MTLYPEKAPTILPRVDYDVLLEYAAPAKAVLEFGPGISTLAFFEARVPRIVSYEHDARWLHKQRHRLTPLVPSGVWWELRHYYGRTPILGVRRLSERFDVAFVDAPPGGDKMVTGEGWEGLARYNTLAAAFYLARTVLLHDAQREGEQATIAMIGCQHKMLTEKMALCWM